MSKQFLGKTTDTHIPSLLVNDKLITDTTDKCEIFNNSFSNISTIDDMNASLPDMVYHTGQRLSSVTVSEQDVLDQLLSLDVTKALGPDNISPYLLKISAHVLAPSLTRLVKLSLTTMIVPSLWKLANVCPVYKKGNRSDINNHRPISLISCVGKLVKRILFKNIFNYLKSNELLSIYQSGFIPKDSTELQLINLVHALYQALDVQDDALVVYCDISKAFDRVWIKGLLHKLQQYGTCITGNLHHWFQSYLTGRKQRVHNSGCNSSWAYLSAGVQQGSVLGPLLFLIYINDMTYIINTNIRLFADDATLFSIGKDVNILHTNLQHDLFNIQ